MKIEISEQILTNGETTFRKTRGIKEKNIIKYEFGNEKIEFILNTNSLEMKKITNQHVINLNLNDNRSNMLYTDLMNDYTVNLSVVLKELEIKEEKIKFNYIVENSTLVTFTLTYLEMREE